MNIQPQSDGIYERQITQEQINEGIARMKVAVIVGAIISLVVFAVVAFYFP